MVLTFHLPSNLLAAQGEGEGKWKVSLCLVAPPEATAEYSTTSSFCWRTTLEDICAVRKVAHSDLVAHYRGYPTISNRAAANKQFCARKNERVASFMQEMAENRLGDLSCLAERGKLTQ